MRPRNNDNKVLIFNRDCQLIAVADSFYNAARLTGTGTQRVRYACANNKQVNGYSYRTAANKTLASLPDNWNTFKI